MTMTREQKVDLAYTGLATAATIAAVMAPVVSLPLLAARIVGIAAVNALGSECTKGALKFFEGFGYKVEKKITVNGTSETAITN